MANAGFWADLKAAQFRELPDNTIAVLPIGAIEQHGPHLPVSVDTDLVEAVSSQALQCLGAELSVYVLPTLSITKSNEHNRHPGTLALSAETLLAVLRDIGASVARSGIQRLVLFNGHGGNTALLEVAARDLRVALDLIVATCGWFAFADQSAFDKDALAVDLHAGDLETSAMLALRPEHVDMSKAANFRTAMQDWQERSRFIGLTGEAAKPAWIIDDLCADGACGNASAATVEKGQALIDSAARNFAEFLAEFARFDHRAVAGQQGND